MKIKCIFLAAVLLLCQLAMAEEEHGICSNVMKASAGSLSKCQFDGAVLTIAPVANVGQTSDKVARIDTLLFAYDLSELWSLRGTEAVMAIQTTSTNRDFCRVLTRKSFEEGLPTARKIRDGIIEGEVSPMLGQHYGKNGTILFYWERAKKIPCPKIDD